MLHKRRGVTLVVGMFVLTTTLMLPTSGTANAVEVPDQVLAWNQHAYHEFFVAKVPALPPPISIFNFSIMHAAIYDAVNAIDGGYEPYLETPAVEALADPSDSKGAAAAKAGQVTLLWLVPEAAAAINGYYADSVQDSVGRRRDPAGDRWGSGRRAGCGGRDDH